uniref:NET domain-containing protein n=1 Tax=viral metagenome TaxID=1070528 RepID=A0A6C0F439_9ZZZZ|tara:strand:- start:10268 stop:10651 length:384 start_codon:yes stop_codon:yes gene_type:complete
MNIDNKRYFIYNNIESLENHDNFIKILHKNNCEHTSNTNGIFVNLNTIDGSIIEELFFILSSEINNDNKIDIKRNDFIEHAIKLTEKKPVQIIKKDNIIKTQLYMNDFPEEEHDIIRMSKINKFDNI